MISVLQIILYLLKQHQNLRIASAKAMLDC